MTIGPRAGLRKAWGRASPATSSLIVATSAGRVLQRRPDADLSKTSRPNRSLLMLFSWRMVVLFIHVTSVIVALGGSLFSTFALTPILAQELEDFSRVSVARRVI